MKDTIVYRPYRSHAWFLPFTIPVGMLAFIFAGYCLPFWGFYAIVPVAIGIACTWLTKVLYDYSRVAVFFEQEGLRVIGSSYNDYRYVLWEELSYAYYVRSFKGHLFAVLSPKALSPKEAKKLANRGANSTRICIDDTVVIHLEDILQDGLQIKEFIENHVAHMDTY